MKMEPLTENRCRSRLASRSLGAKAHLALRILVFAVILIAAALSVLLDIGIVAVDAAVDAGVRGIHFARNRSGRETTAPAPADGQVASGSNKERGF